MLGSSTKIYIRGVADENIACRVRSITSVVSIYYYISVIKMMVVKELTKP